MKSITTFEPNRRSWWWACLLATGLLASSLTAAETNAPAKTDAPAKTNAPAAEAEAPLTQEEMFEGGKETYNNWIDLSVGTFFVGGNDAQFQERHQNRGGTFGGIEDFHYFKEIDKTTTFNADGRALFDENDYKLSLGVVREKLGYLRFSYEEFRTWYDAHGGYYPPSGLWYPLSSDALSLDRGEISFESGLRLENIPKITFKYTHAYRDGEKGSTSWGFAHPEANVTRGLGPSFYDIDENSDTFQLDVAHQIKATELGLMLRYESGQADNALKINQWPGEAIERKITDREGTTYDWFTVRAFSETWLEKNLFLSSSFSFSDLNNDLSGSRIYGSDFDVGYVPNTQNGSGYYGLNGTTHLYEYLMNLNLLYKPWEHFSITPSLRAQKEDVEASFDAFETLGDNPAAPFSGNSDRGVLDVREQLDMRYTRVTNWVFYARGEWTEGSGDLRENGGLIPVNGIGVPPVDRQTDDDRFFQKYSAGFRWYPARRVTLDAGGYYKIHQYDYDHDLDTDSTPNNTPNAYPAYLVMQDFETYDGNVGLTLRPWQRVTLVSRYEFQLSTTHTQPDSLAGLGEVESSEMTRHIIAQNVSWSPWSRLSLQVGFNYVLSETKTPTSEFTEAILDAQNNYWTLNFSSSLVVDDKTDLNVGYFYYRADNYDDNSTVGVPYGAEGEEHGITAAIVRRLTRNIRLTLKYGYFHYNDVTFGGNEDYNSHVLFSSLQYRF